MSENISYRWVIAILKNMSTGKYHPILWEQAPLPGGEESGVNRYRSRMHHTGGFVKHEEAVEGAQKLSQDVSEFYGGNVLTSEDLIEWGGEDIPVNTMILSDKNVVIL